MPEDNISSIIDKYRKKSGEKDPNIRFIFNAKALNTSLSISEFGISHDANYIRYSDK